MSDDKFRRLRAVLRTALTWGAAWGVAGGAITAAIALFDPNPAIESLPERLGMAAISGVAWGVRFAVVGAVIGAAFSTVIRLGYRGKRLADINPARFGLLGALVGGIGVPLYLQTMNVLSGGAIPWGLVLDDAPLGALFGGAAAAGSILLARRAEALPDSSDVGTKLDRADDVGELPAGEPRDTLPAQRSAAAEHLPAPRGR